MGKKKDIKKETNCENCCFVCKDGGHLRLCDYGWVRIAPRKGQHRGWTYHICENFSQREINKYCLKVYHPQCVEKDDSFLENGDRWVCGWHSCLYSQRAAKFQCFCCPRAVCKRCFSVSGLIVVKWNKGFCSHCLKLAQMVEENKDVDCDGVKIDFEDQDTYECLFKMYWITVKEKENLSLELIHVAANPSRKVKNYECDHADDYFAYNDYESPPDVSDSDDLSYTEQGELSGRRNRFRKKRNSVKDNVDKKKIEFVGWASKSLADFLSSVGIEITTELPHYEVTSIVTHYCEERKLFQPGKKKKILCDERLQLLLRKKSINKNNLHRALERHFPVNWEQSQDDKDTSSNCTDDNGSSACRRKQNITLDRGFKRDRSDSLQQRFASIIPQNIKLVYLNRSLVQELLMYPEHFESKVVGCFVRVKSDPNDFMQKNSHLLLQVTGVKRSLTTGDSETGIFLLAPYIIHDIDICKISDDDFSEEECEDLRQRMNTGLLKRPTVLELKQKAISLHVDKTKHWIQRELTRLQRLIDGANLKGRRREFEQYWERRNLLQTPSEKSRLLDTVPEVLADTEDLQSPVYEKENHDFSESIHSMPSLTPAMEHKGSGHLHGMNRNEDAAGEIFQTVESMYKTTQHNIDGTYCQESHVKVKEDEIGENVVSISTFDIQENSTVPPHPTIMLPQLFDSQKGNTGSESTYFQPGKQHHSGCITRLQGQPNEHNLPGVEVIHLTDDDTPEVHFGQQSKPQSQPRDIEQVKAENWSAGVELIDLSDDQADSEVALDKDDALDRDMTENANCEVWYIKSSGCGTRGPFSLSLLKNWIESQAIHFDFKVWREGQSEEEAILLTNAIQLFYPQKLICKFMSSLIC